MMIFDCKKSRVQFETLYKMDEEHSWICTLFMLTLIVVCIIDKHPTMQS